MAKKQETKKLDLEGLDFGSLIEDEDTNDPTKLTPVETVEDEPETEEEDVSKSLESDEEESEESEEPESSEDEDEVEDSDEVEEELTLVDEIKQMLGYEFGEDVEFEDSAEGLVDLTKAAASKMAEIQLESLFDAYPDVKQYMVYRSQGGDSAQFFRTFFGDVDFSTIDLEENDTVSQEQVVRRALEAQGFEPPDITEAVSEMKNSGTLYTQSQRYQKVLAKEQKKSKEELLRNQEREAKAAEAEREKFVEDMNTTIRQSKQFHGIPISEKEKASLVDFILKFDEDGTSAFQKALANAPIETHLAIATLIKRNFNLDGVVTRKAKSQNAQTLRDKLLKSKERKASKSSRSKGVVENPDFNTLDFSLI